MKQHIQKKQSYIAKLFTIICTFLLFFFYTTPVFAQSEEMPILNSEYVYLVDLNSNEVIYEKNSDTRIFPASMTKMLTEIIALESLPDFNQKITITYDMIAGLFEANASVAGFAVGDQPTVEDLLYAIALPSGADAVNAIAFIISGNTEKFVEKMNQKANEIGMNNTHFENPTGLHHENHYSTCSDIAKLLRYCSQNEKFKQIISNRTYTTGALASHPKGITMYSTVWKNINTDKNSLHIPGFLGGKTGYTQKAGYCLASLASINNMNLMLITAKSLKEGDNLKDASYLYQWMEQNYEQRVIITKNDIIQTINVKDTFPFKTIDIKVPTDITLPVPKNSDITIQTTIDKTLIAPIHSNQTLGEIEILANQKIIYHFPFVIDQKIPRNNLIHFINQTIFIIQNHIFISIILLLFLVFVAIILMRHMAIAKHRRLRRKRRQQRNNIYSNRKKEKFTSAIYNKH